MSLEIVLCVIVVAGVWLMVWPTERNTTEPPYPECMDCNKGDCEGCAVPWMMLIHKLNSTSDCIKVANDLTFNQAMELKRTRKMCIANADKYCKEHAWDMATLMAVKSQFCRETLEFSKHSGVLT